MFARYNGGILARLMTSPTKLAKNILPAAKLAQPKSMCKPTLPSSLKEDSKRHLKSSGKIFPCL
jgi:hypothetical protein